MTLSLRPPAEIYYPLVEVVIDAQLARFERLVRREGQTQPTCHLHRAQSHPLSISWEVLNQDGRMAQAS